MPSQILLFAQPRTGSTMLERVISHPENVKLMSHVFSGGRITQLQWLQSEDWEQGMGESDRSSFDAAMQKDLELWKSNFAEAQQKNEILMVNLHIFFAVSPEQIVEFYHYTDRKFCPEGGVNPTIIPNELLLRPGTLPVFTIRNPRLVAPSAMRVLGKFGFPNGAGRPNYQIVTSNIWNHVLYDFFVAHDIQPIVVDADDYMTSEAFIRHLYSKLGFDPAKAYVSWPDEGDRDKHHPMYYASQETLLNSTGLNPNLAAKNKNLEEEESRWQEEFGEDLPRVQEMIDLAMPHYEYLYTKRLQL